MCSGKGKNTVGSRLRVMLLEGIAEEYNEKD